MRFTWLFLVILFAFALTSVFAQDSIAEELLLNLNDARQDIGLNRLYFNPQLQTAAQRHSDDMAGVETLAHIGTDGSQFWQRIQESGYPLTVGAENVLSRGDSNAEAAFQQWFSSEAHRLNMLNPDYQELGIAYTRSASGRYYFTMLLATRADFVAPIPTLLPSATLLPSSTPLATLTPTSRPTDALVATLSAPLPTNTINATQASITRLVTNTPFPTATEVIPPDIRLVYDNNSLALINISGNVLNLANLAFESASGSLLATRWNTEFLSQPLSGFSNGDCLQVWSAEIDFLPKPQECRIRHAWILVNDEADFWHDTDIFTVLNNNQRVGLCRFDLGICEVNISRPIEELAVLNPATVSQPNDLRLDYNNLSFSLTNIAERSLDLRGLVFRSDSGTLAIEQWNTEFLSQPLSGFTAGDCLQVWSLGTTQQSKPAGCQFRHAWILVNDLGDFWRNVDSFTVERNNVLLARCQIQLATCNISLAANYGTVSNPSDTNQANQNNTPEFRLYITTASVALVNTSGQAIDISALAFESDNGVFTASRWQVPELSASLTAFPRGGCLQVWEVGGQFQASPSECQLRHAWVAVGADAQFWLNVNSFRVRLDATVLATCETRQTICDVNLP